MSRQEFLGHADMLGSRQRAFTPCQKIVVSLHFVSSGSSSLHTQFKVRPNSVLVSRARVHQKETTTVTFGRTHKRGKHTHTSMHD